MYGCIAGTKNSFFRNSARECERGKYDFRVLTIRRISEENVIKSRFINSASPYSTVSYNLLDNLPRFPVGCYRAENVGKKASAFPCRFPEDEYNTSTTHTCLILSLLLVRALCMVSWLF